MLKFPYTTRPEDIPVMLHKLQNAKTPSGKVETGFIKSLGFSANSRNYLLEILKKLGFIDIHDKPSDTWKAYATEPERRGLVLASALKSAYKEIFKAVLCPYLEGDESLEEIFQHEAGKSNPKQTRLLIDTFRNLCELADFQDMLCIEEPVSKSTKQKEEPVANVKVNPALQLNIQIHIDPKTPDEKIETIFKNMRKYLFDKERN
jgi:hypothetical protein